MLDMKIGVPFLEELICLIHIPKFTQYLLEKKSDTVAIVFSQNNFVSYLDFGSLPFENQFQMTFQIDFFFNFRVLESMKL